VLAGGDSRRMGSDKADVVYESTPLLDRAVRLVEPLADRVLVVGRHVPDGRFAAVEAHLDACPNAGPLGGIATALKLSAPHACLIVPCDMPLLTQDLLRRLIQACVGEVDCALVDNPMRGRLEPLVGVYAARCLPPMEQAIAAGRLAIWRTLKLLTVHGVTVPDDQRDQLVNLNTPRDLSGSRTSGS